METMSPPVASSSEQCPLSGAISVTHVYDIKRVGQFRRYGGSMSTVAPINGVDRIDVKNIFYSVGMAKENKTLPPLSDDMNTQRYAQKFEMNEVLFQELNSKMHSYVGSTPDFSTADLSGVICRLSMALAQFSFSGYLSMQDLRGSGVPLRVRAMTTIDRALPSEGFVFIPQHASLHDCPAAVSALICAANGAGALAVTDILAVNPLNNAPRILSFQNGGLAHGCMVALRIVLSMYEASGAGSIAGLAVTKGIHSVMSVSGHTDEGGYMRDVLRKGEFATSFGGIYAPNLLGFMHFPTFVKGDRGGAISLVDSIALMTAAACAVSDPLVEVGGRKYPTTFTRGKPGKSGAAAGAQPAGANKSIRNQIAVGCGQFSKNYVAELGRIICGNVGGADSAASALGGMFTAAAYSLVNNRHIVGETVAPFYWVEPTSLYRRRQGTAADLAGYGVLAGTMETVASDAYPKARILIESTDVMGVAFEMRSLRTVPAIVHSYYNQLDGLAHVKPYQAFPTRFALTGSGHDPDHPAGETVEDNLRERRGLDAYAWKHGTCMIPSPAECMYVGANIAAEIAVRHVEFGSFNGVANHVVTPYDHGGTCVVKYTASRPRSFEPGGSADIPSEARRGRGDAETMLSALNDRAVGRKVNNPLALTTQMCEPGGFFATDIDDQLELQTEVEGESEPYRLPTRHQHGNVLATVTHDAPQRYRAPATATRGVTSAVGVPTEDAATIGEGALPTAPVEEGGNVAGNGDPDYIVELVAPPPEGAAEGGEQS